jgi:nitrogen fixation protein NifQ
MNGPDRQAYRHSLFAELIGMPVTARIAVDPNRSLFASMLAGQSAGFGCLSKTLGLDADRHQQLLFEYFPDEQLHYTARAEIPIPEKEDLLKLLLEHRALEHHSEIWIAEIVASACAGRDHLWQDLGLTHRDELSKLMWVNFPELARANSADMKWKKFLYRQFCSREGIYVCPAPSCGECKDYAQCFGPEN